MILGVLNLVAVGCILVFRRFLFSYTNEKGKNLATKEDIAEITRLAEQVRSEYSSEIERLRTELGILTRKHGILFDEKVRVFKKLQARLVAFKNFCRAARFTYDPQGEFHGTLDTLPDGIERASLAHLTALDEILQEDFIFLTEESRRSLHALHSDCSIMCSMELHIAGSERDPAVVGNAAEVYDHAISNIDSCLESLYQELEFPSR